MEVLLYLFYFKELKVTLAAIHFRVTRPISSTLTYYFRSARRLIKEEGNTVYITVIIGRLQISTRASRQTFWVARVALLFPMAPSLGGERAERLASMLIGVKHGGRPSIRPRIIIHEYCALCVFLNCSTATFYFASSKTR